jgi:hypothetical protein
MDSSISKKIYDTKRIKRAKYIYNTFVELAILTELQDNVFRTRLIDNWTIQKQAIEFGWSEATINRTIRDLKDMYDEIQALHPDRLPVRGESEIEDYMDNN